MNHTSQLRALARYSSAATPWGLLAVTGVTSVGLLSLVARWPTALWPLHGAAIGLLAGVSAWSADERCAAIVDVTPRPLWWRTLARTPTALLLLAIWVALHLVVRDRLPEHLDVLVVQGLSAASAGFAAATWQRTRAHADPGQRMALVVCPLAAAVALARPWSDRVPLFPIWPHENWPRAMTIWSILGGAALVLTAAALRHDARSARTPRPRSA